VIPNLGPQRDVWGWADYEFVRTLARYIPLILFGREADILKAVLRRRLHEKGTGQPTPPIERSSPRAASSSPAATARSSPSPRPTSRASPTHAQSALEMFKMVGFAPDAAWGDGRQAPAPTAASSSSRSSS
jgi:hypothetical protein